MQIHHNNLSYFNYDNCYHGCDDYENLYKWKFVLGIASLFENISKL